MACLSSVSRPASAMLAFMFWSFCCAQLWRVVSYIIYETLWPVGSFKEAKRIFMRVNVLCLVEELILQELSMCGDLQQLR